MQEFSVPVIRVVKPDDNVTDDVFANAENWPDAAGFKRKVNGTWTPVTWREFAGQVRGLAAGFIAAGIQPGDRVALMSRTRFEWTLVESRSSRSSARTSPRRPAS
jgi:long-chain acyl-CoA synthetase